jgi:hypothetical protein
MRFAKFGRAGVPSLTAAALALWVALALSDPPPAVAGGGGYAGAGGKGDFNADGFADLAIGAPGEDSNAGAVNVIYGTATGLNATGDQILRQGGDLKDTPEPGDRFGAALAVGDINGDGFADLAVGAPGENGGAVNGAGAVSVIFGSPGGLDAFISFNDQFRTQNSAGILDSSETGDQFGKALGAVRFGAKTAAGTQRAALAIGAPGEDIGGKTDAGAVNLIYSGGVGLKSSGNQLFRQGAGGLPATPGSGDHFGAALQSANFGKTAATDLAIGAPGDGFGAFLHAGSVTLLYGRSSGPSATGSQLWTQQSAGVGDSSEKRDAFGSALAAGNFDGDRQADLAVGVPNEDVAGKSNAGAVNLIHGHSGGLTGSGGQFLTQNTAGVADKSEGGDNFGTAVAAADLGHSSRSDLAIGAPGENLAIGIQEGAVNVLYGGTSGVTATGDQFLSQGHNGVAGDKAGGSFGFALGARNFGRGAKADLAVGVPFSFNAAENALIGHVAVLYGSSTGLLTSNDQRWSQDSTGIADSGEDGDLFGLSVGPPLSPDAAGFPP